MIHSIYVIRKKPLNPYLKRFSGFLLNNDPPGYFIWLSTNVDLTIYCPENVVTTAFTSVLM